MKNNQSIIFYLLSNVRANFMRRLKPASSYWLPTRSVKPLSRKHGFDRGTPIDRYYIEKFFVENARFIKGTCLEVGDNRYTVTYGGSKVIKSEVIDVNKKNIKATIYRDLRNVSSVKDNAFDCIIITYVLGLIDDIESATSELHRMLKPGGTLLFVGSGISSAANIKMSYWRFTIEGTRFLFRKYFKNKEIHIQSYGNVLIAQSILLGMAQEELKKDELQYNDLHYPCIVTVRAIKK